MGLFDQLAGEALNALGAGLSGKAEGDGLARWLPVAMALLQKTGGVEGLIQRFNEAGLAGVVASWISAGGNEALSSQQLLKAVGAPLIEQLAAQFGFGSSETAEGLARFLPQAVDQLTPEGAVSPQTAELFRQGLSLLAGLGK